MWTLLSDPLAQLGRTHARRPGGRPRRRERHLRRAAGPRRAGLARRLCALGTGPDVRVAVCLEPSTDLLVALLGVLRAGGAYVPLDPATPPARLLHLLGDARASTLITSPATAGLLGAYPGTL